MNIQWPRILIIVMNINVIGLAFSSSLSLWLVFFSPSIFFLIFFFSTQPALKMDHNESI